MYAILTHLSFSLALTVAVTVFFIMHRGDPRLEKLDRVPLYEFDKYSVNLDDLKNALQVNTSNNWIDSDLVDTSCLDLRPYDWPRISYYSADGLTDNLTSPAGNPSCQVDYTWGIDVGGTSGAIAITGVSLRFPAACTPGSYLLKLTKYNALSTLASVTPLNVTIASDKTVSFNQLNTVLGSGFVSRKLGWTTCMTKRAALASEIQRLTDCVTENSQFCSCVYLFSNPLRNGSFVAPLAAQRSVKPSSVLYDGISKCAMSRRARDRYKVSSLSDHKQSQMLFIISMCVLMNVLYHLFHHIQGEYVMFTVKSSFWRNGWYIAIMIISIVVAFLSGLGGSSNAWIEILPASLAMLAMSGYYEIFYLSNQSDDYYKLYKPTVHPFYFSMIYNALTSYILVHRGVTDLMTLSIEGIKGVAVALLYMKVVIYYTTEQNASKGKVIVDRSQVIAIALLCVMGLDMLYTPYYDYRSFSLIWLLPFAWIIICISESVWMRYYEVGYGDASAVKDHDKDLSYIHVRRNIALTLVNVVCLWVVAHLYTQYILLKDSSNDFFAYPTPLSYRFLLHSQTSLPGYLHEGL
jgi:hypothetical protein